MRSILAVVVALLALPVAAKAQDGVLRHAEQVYVVAAAADWTTTIAALDAGGTERNPVDRLFGSSPNAVRASMVLVDVAGEAAWTRWVGVRHPRLAAVGLYAMASVRVWAAAHNLRTIAWQRQSGVVR